MIQTISTAEDLLAFSMTYKLDTENSRAKDRLDMAVKIWETFGHY